MSKPLLLNVDYFSPTPLYQQIAVEIECLIKDGILYPGERLPSVRQMAQQLRVSTITVRRAMETLVSSNAIRAREGSGHFVEGLRPDRQLSFAPPVNENVRANVDARNAIRCDFSASGGSQAALARLLPADRLRTVAGDFLRMQDSEVDPLGLPKLRALISATLNNTRGLQCSADQILIVSDAKQAMSLIARVLGKNREVVFADPTYPEFTLPFRDEALELKFTCQSEDGLALSGFRHDALIHVSPTSGYPISPIMNRPGRERLLDWSLAHNAVIVENESLYINDGFHHRVPALHALAREKDEPVSVIYVSSLSSLCPDLMPLGIVVLPDELVKPFAFSKWLLDGGTCLLTQLLALEVLGDDFLHNNLKSLNAAIELKASILQTYLHSFPAWLMDNQPTFGGTRHVLTFKGNLNDELVREKAFELGIDVTSLSGFYHTDEPKTGLFLDARGIDEGSIPFCSEQLYKAILVSSCT